jgi:DNA-binding response OmpR family regulator
MPISVVVAEHLRSSAAVITRLLETNGYAAAAVASAKAALAVCRERSVDIVISRVSFADSMNGVDLAYKLEGSGTFVILFSPFREDLLKQRVPGFTTTTALYVDTQAGLADLLGAVQGFAAFRANHSRINPRSASEDARKRRAVG